jgi:DNA-binding MarR family transcriptional regulator
MSRGPEKTRAEKLAALVRAMRQANGLGASFFRAAAGRVGMTVTDLQVIDLLDSTGPMTAGQLADLTGLTTGAITGMLNRLEEATIVRRERDPEDGRKVIVSLVPGTDGITELSAIFVALEHAWEEVLASFDDAQLSFLLDFLERSNAQTQRALIQVRTTPGSEGNAFSAPLEGVASGRLVVAGFAKLTLRTDKTMTELYQAQFEGPTPEVKVADGVVTIRYPRRLWEVGSKRRTANIVLNVTIPWQIVVQGGAAEIIADLSRANLAGLEMGGGANVVHLELPMPRGVVPIRISGGASSITVHRPVGAAARVHLKGWVSTFVFDDKRLSDLGNDVRLQSTDYDANAPYYDIEVASSASAITITSD